MWIIVLTALLVGILVGLTGVGAGALMTPLLVGVFGVSLPVAIATDLIFATVTKAIGAPFHHRQGSINWVLARRLWMGSIPGTLVGVALVVFGVSRESTEWLLWPLVAIVLFTSLTLGIRAVGKKGLDLPEKEPKVSPFLLAPLGGFGIGAGVALTSVGAGALGMALLVRLTPAKVKPQELVGTDLVHAIPIALIAGLAYSGAGLVSWSLLATMLLGSIPGVIIGSLGTGKVSSRLLSGGLSAILAAVVVLILLNQFD